MKRRGCIVGFCIILVALTMTRTSILRAQETTPTQIPIDSNMMIAFPGLDCQDIEPPFAGPTWNGVTIGSSNVNDLRNLVSELSSSYIENFYTSFQITSFSVSNKVAEAESVPPVISACVHPDDQKVVAISVLTRKWFEQIRAEDLVAAHGAPDLVLWDDILSARVLIWLTKGIAASVSVDTSEQFIPYGIVTQMIYFPFQTLEGYEERWPYTAQSSTSARVCDVNS